MTVAEREFLTLKEAVQHAKLDNKTPIRTITRWIRLGRFPAKDLRHNQHSWLVSKDGLDRVLADIAKERLK